MPYLLIAVAALALGPLALDRLRQHPALGDGIDGFVLVSITGLVFLHFVPQALEEGSYGVLAALLVGFLLPLVLERFSRRAEGPVDRLGLLLGFSGLAIHAVLDGAALATVEGGSDAPLALAVILHRFPAGIAVWWLAATVWGRRSGVAAIVVLMAATVAGFYFGASLLQIHGNADGIQLYQALVGGALMHVAVHPGHARQRGSERWAEGWGGIAAVVLLISASVLPGLEDEAGQLPFLLRFSALLAESAPALLLAYLCAGLLTAFMPSASIRWLGRGRPLTQAVRGMLVGQPFPICSCGVVPLYRSLVARGAPPAAALAFLVATPELGLDAVLLSIPLLGPDVTILRLITGATAALLVGWLVGGRLNALPTSHEHGEEHDSGETLGSRFRTAITTGTGEVVDHTAPWILLGLAVAALVVPLVDGGWLAQLPSPVAIVLFAALGFPMYVCAASATPLVATLIAVGLSPGAGIAFLITGPATNLSTLGVISGLHGRNASGAFAITLVVFAVSAGLLVDWVFPSLRVPTLTELTQNEPSAVQLTCLVGLMLLFGASLARRGVRHFAAEISAGLGWDHDQDDHGHGHHHHDHGHAHS